MALGEIKLSYNDFYALTPRSFTNVINGFRNREYEDQKLSWEQTRYLFYASLKPHLKGNPSLKKLMPLPWDVEDMEEGDAVLLTPEQAEKAIAEASAKWEEIDRKRLVNQTNLNQKEDGEFSTD